MPNPRRQKGDRAELELAEKLRSWGIRANRLKGSGAGLEDHDIEAAGLLFEVKSRKIMPHGLRQAFGNEPHIVSQRFDRLGWYHTMTDDVFRMLLERAGIAVPPAKDELARRHR